MTDPTRWTRELEVCATELRASLDATRRHLERSMGDVNPYGVVDNDGRPVLAPMLVALTEATAVLASIYDPRMGGREVGDDA